MTTLEAQHEVITNLILENQKLKQERDEAREAIRDAVKWFDWALRVMNPPFDFDKFVAASEALKKLEAAK